MMLVAIVNKRGLGNLLFIFVFTGWMTTFRMVRNEFVSIKGETYVKVCEAFGMSRMNIMFKQILPNVMSPIIVSTTTNVAFSFFRRQPFPLSDLVLRTVHLPGEIFSMLRNQYLS